MRIAVSKRLALAVIASAVLFACATAVDDNSSPSGTGTPPTDDSGSAGDSAQGADNYTPPPPDTGTTDSSTSDSTASDAGSDTGGNDAGSDGTNGGDGSTCVTVTTGTGANDGGTCPAPVSGTCGMGSLSGYTPTWIPPSGLHQGKCSLSDIQTIYDDCWGPNANSVFCSSDQGACYSCLVTEEFGSPKYGPLILVQNDALVYINYAGCLALLEPCNQPCAAAIAADFQCENAACEANCPVSDQNSYNQYVACQSTADGCKTGCDTYATEAAQCIAQVTGPQHPGSVCMPANNSTFAKYYASVAPVFCGP